MPRLNLAIPLFLLCLISFIAAFFCRLFWLVCYALFSALFVWNFAPGCLISFRGYSSIEGGDTEEELEDAIEECYGYIEEWEDIAGMMGGTVFLDYCESLAWNIIERAYEKANRFESQLAMLEIKNAIMGGFGF